MTTKTKPQQLPVYAADIGNNTSKGIGPNGLTVTFPSVVGYPERLLYQGSITTNGAALSSVQNIQLSTERGDRFIGDLAIQQSKQKWSPQGRFREQTNTVKILLLALLSELGAEGKIRLITGLPVSDFTEAQRSELTKELQGKHTIARAGRKPVEVEIVDLDIKPQPLGTLYRQMFSLEGGKAKVISQDLRQAKVGILDIGGFTTDFALIHKMVYLNNHSGSIETGMNHLYNLLADKIKELHRATISQGEAEAAFRASHLRIRGQKVKIAQLADQLLEVLSMAVLQRATDLWGDGATIDVIYITGGGASSLGPYLARTYSQAIIVEESHLANVQGYFRFAHILWER